MRKRKKATSWNSVAALFYLGNDSSPHFLCDSAKSFSLYARDKTRSFCFIPSAKTPFFTLLFDRYLRNYSSFSHLYRLFGHNITAFHSCQCLLSFFVVLDLYFLLLFDFYLLFVIALYLIKHISFNN